MKKGVKIFLIILVLLLCCCMSIGVGGFFLLNSVVASTSPIQELAFELCEEKGDLTSSKFSSMFSDVYQEEVTLTETQDFLDSLFPSDFNCSDLKGNNIITLMMKGYSISSESDLNTTFADYDVTIDGTSVSFYYVYENNNWYVEGIYYNN